jgi:hypothetical protein
MLIKYFNQCRPKVLLKYERHLVTGQVTTYHFSTRHRDCILQWNLSTRYPGRRYHHGNRHQKLSHFKTSFTSQDDEVNVSLFFIYF